MDRIDPLVFNETFDKVLEETKILTKEIFIQFYDAYSYDASTTINWLIQKLKILNKRFENGETIDIYDSENVLDKLNFKHWIEKEFPNLMKRNLYIP